MPPDRLRTALTGLATLAVGSSAGLRLWSGEWGLSPVLAFAVMMGQAVALAYLFRTGSALRRGVAAGRLPGWVAAQAGKHEGLACLPAALGAAAAQAGLLAGPGPGRSSPWYGVLAGSAALGFAAGAAAAVGASAASRARLVREAKTEAGSVAVLGPPDGVGVGVGRGKGQRR